MDTLQRWAVKNGAECPHLEAEGRTMRTVDSLAVGDTLMKIPFTLLMHVHRAANELPFANAFRCLSREGASERTLLCLFVASERAKGVCSFWWPYLRMLPQTFTTPLWYEDEEKEAVRGTRVAAGMGAEQDALNELVVKWGRKFLNAARNTMGHACALGAPPGTSDDPCAGRAWYHERWDRHRSNDSDGNASDDSPPPCAQELDWMHSSGGEMEEPYSISGHGEKQRERDRRGDITANPDYSDDEAREKYVKNMDIAWETVTNENLKWARSVVFSRAFTLRWGAGHTIALVPLFDMLDHSPAARLTWLTDEAKGTVTFSTDAAIPSGQVVYNNYGQKPNEELLQGYGFVVSDNPAERFVVKLAMGSGRPGDESDGEEDTTWRKALIDGLRATSLQFKLSLANPLPAAFLDAARLLALNEPTAYACVQTLDKLREGGWRKGSAKGGGDAEGGPGELGAGEIGLGTQGVIPRYPYLDLQVVARLTSLLERSRKALAGGKVEDDLKAVVSLDAEPVRAELLGGSGHIPAGIGTDSGREADGRPPEKRLRQSISEPGDLDDAAPKDQTGLNETKVAKGLFEESESEDESTASEPEDEEFMDEEDLKYRREWKEGRAERRQRRKEERKRKRDPFGHAELGPFDDVIEAEAAGGAQRMKWAILYRLGQKQIIDASLVALRAMAASLVVRACPVVALPGGYNREPRYAAWRSEVGIRSFALEELWPIDGPGGRTNSSEAATANPPEVAQTSTSAIDSVFEGFTLRPALCVTRDCVPGQRLSFLSGGSLLTGDIPRGLKKLLEELGGRKNGGKRALAQLKKCPGDAGVAIALMWERSLGSQSDFAPFVDALVRLPASAVTWDDSALDKLAGTHLHDVISMRRDDLQEQYAQFLESVIAASPSPSFRAAFSPERFFWAMQIVDVYSVVVAGGPGDPSGRRVLAPVLSFLPRPLLGAAVSVRWGGPPKAAKAEKRSKRDFPSGMADGTEAEERSQDAASKAANAVPLPEKDTPQSEEPPKKKVGGQKRGVWLEAACALPRGSLLLYPTEGLDSETLMLDFGADLGPRLRAAGADVSTAGAGADSDVSKPRAGANPGPEVSARASAAADASSSDADVIPGLPWDYAYFQFGCPEGGSLNFARAKLGYATNLCGIHYLGGTVAPARVLDAMMVATAGIDREGRFKVEQAQAVNDAWDALQAVGPSPWNARGGTDEAKDLAEEHGERVAAAQAELAAKVAAFKAFLRTNEVQCVALEAAEMLLPGVRESIAGGDAESDHNLWKATRERMEVAEAELGKYGVECVEGKMAVTRLVAQGVNAAVYAHRHRQKQMLDEWIRTFREMKRTFHVEKRTPAGKEEEAPKRPKKRKARLAE